MGLIEGVSDAASTVMKLFSGWLADRVKFYKPILILGYATTPLFVGLIGLAHSVWPVLWYRTAAWMGRGIREPIRDTWIANITGSRYYGRVFGFHRAADTFGAIIGPLCAFIFLQQFSLRTIFFLSVIPGICSVISLLMLSEQEEQHKHVPNRRLWDDIKNLPLEFQYFLGTMFIFGLGNFHQVLLIYRVQELLSVPGLQQGYAAIIASSWGCCFMCFSISYGH